MINKKSGMGFMKKKEYVEYTESRAKRTKSTRNCFMAFVSGGIVCCLGQTFIDIYKYLGVAEKDASFLGSCSLIFLAGLLTAFGRFDTIARYCGAGLLVPITGFANSIAAAAIDNKSEGFITGLGTKIFIIAGPVIVYGTAASVVYGVVYYLLV